MPPVGIEPLVEGVVLAPGAFYNVAGARRQSVAPRRDLAKSFSENLGITVHVAVWDAMTGSKRSSAITPASHRIEPREAVRPRCCLTPFGLGVVRGPLSRDRDRRGSRMLVLALAVIHGGGW